MQTSPKTFGTGGRHYFSPGTRSFVATVLLTIALLGIAFLLPACGGPGVTEGKVTAMEYEPAETEVRPTTSQKCTGTGKKRTCRTVTGTTSSFDDEDWEITITNDKGESATFEVSEQTYNSLKVGDSYKRD